MGDITLLHHYMYMYVTVGFELGSVFCLGRFVWLVMDDYYCSETTTAQACLGYVSLGCCRQLSIHNADEGQPARNRCPLFAWFALRTPYFMCKKV